MHIMENLLIRSITSIPLLVIAGLSIINNDTFVLLLIVISFLVLIEIYNLIKKIFYKNKIKIFIFYFISIIYILIFFPQLYLFLIFDLNNQLLFIFILSICVATDIGGYEFGKFFQGKKLTKISPKKTFSGLIGSFILSFIVFLYFKLYFNFQNNFFIFTFLISSISQSGDLFISYLKRKAKIKDTGNILPGHGGILDRIDGIIFALPIGINLLVLFK